MNRKKAIVIYYIDRDSVRVEAAKKRLEYLGYEVDVMSAEEHGQLERKKRMTTVVVDEYSDI